MEDPHPLGLRVFFCAILKLPLMARRNCKDMVQCGYVLQLYSYARMDRSIPAKGGTDLKNRFSEISHLHLRLLGAEERQDADVWAELDRLCDEITAKWRR